MIRRILLDIDDVCNNCTKYALQWACCPMDYDNFDTVYPRELGYDIVAVANRLLGFKRFDIKGFWNMIPQAYWASCPPTQHFEMILDLCADLVGRDHVCFLTGPTKDPGCLAGKLEWIGRYAPEWMHRQYLIGPRKQFAAMHEALLIDDNQVNTDSFCEWGGNALVFPRPWNKNWNLDAGEYITSEFARYSRMNARERYLKQAQKKAMLRAGRIKAGY